LLRHNLGGHPDHPEGDFGSSLAAIRSVLASPVPPKVPVWSYWNSGIVIDNEGGQYGITLRSVARQGSPLRFARLQRRCAALTAASAVGVSIYEKHVCFSVLERTERDTADRTCGSVVPAAQGSEERDTMPKPDGLAALIHGSAPERSSNSQHWSILVDYCLRLVRRDWLRVY
jgi:hypothetical protein